MCPLQVTSCVNSAPKIKLIAENVPFSNCFPRKSALKLELIAENVPFLSCFRENSALKMKLIAENMPFHGSPYKQYAALKH